MVSLRLPLHGLEPGVVVGKLVQVCECDLAGGDGIVPGDVGGRIVNPVLELDAEPGPELLDVERRN